MNFLQLMAFGFLCALLQATIPPFVWLIMGNFVTISINREVIIKNKDKEFLGIQIGKCLRFGRPGQELCQFGHADLCFDDCPQRHHVLCSILPGFLNNLQKERRFSASLLGNIRSSSNIPNQNSLYSEITAYGHCLVGVPPVGASGRHVTWVGAKYYVKRETPKNRNNQSPSLRND